MNFCWPGREDLYRHYGWISCLECNTRMYSVCRKIYNSTRARLLIWNKPGLLKYNLHDWHLYLLTRKTTYYDRMIFLKLGFSSDYSTKNIFECLHCTFSTAAKHNAITQELFHDLIRMVRPYSHVYDIFS